MEGTLIQSKDIAAKFAIASKNSDLELLNKLLSKDGSFHIQDPSLDTIVVSKKEFLKWYKEKLDAVTIEYIDYDQCMFCRIGNTVVLFNHGLFSITFKHNWERSRVGLMIEVQDNKISEVNFCRVFLNTTNKAVFECRAEKIEEYIAQGLTKEQAIKKSLALAPTDLI